MVAIRVAAGIAAVPLALGAGSQATSATIHTRSVFYLNLKAGECALLPMKNKHLRVLPCLNPPHQLEVFAVTHGGWGLAQPPPHRVVVRLSFTICNTQLLERFRHVILPPYGYVAYWPDPGAETQKYGDRMICALVGPGKGPMGSGTHFRK